MARSEFASVGSYFRGVIYNGNQRLYGFAFYLTQIDSSKLERYRVERFGVLLFRTRYLYAVVDRFNSYLGVDSGPKDRAPPGEPAFVLARMVDDLNTGAGSQPDS